MPLCARDGMRVDERRRGTTSAASELKHWGNLIGMRHSDHRHSGTPWGMVIRTRDAVRPLIQPPIMRFLTTKAER
jgi:hypothetical protein